MEMTLVYIHVSKGKNDLCIQLRYSMSLSVTTIIKAKL